MEVWLVTLACQDSPYTHADDFHRIPDIQLLDALEDQLLDLVEAGVMRGELGCNHYAPKLLEPDRQVLGKDRLQVLVLAQ